METVLLGLARLMYLGVFAMAGGMLFRAWKIGVCRDIRYFSDWRGRPPPTAACGHGRYSW